MSNRNFYGVRLVDGQWKIDYSGTMSKAEAKAERDRLNREAVDGHPADFSSSGLGIGGLGTFEETPVIPSARAIERVERLAKQARTCRRCGQSDVFDGAMFTTGGGNVCDDCF